MTYQGKNPTLPTFDPEELPEFQDKPERPHPRDEKRWDYRKGESGGKPAKSSGLKGTNGAVRTHPHVGQGATVAHTGRASRPNANYGWDNTPSPDLDEDDL